MDNTIFLRYTFSVVFFHADVLPLYAKKKRDLACFARLKYNTTVHVHFYINIPLL